MVSDRFQVAAAGAAETVELTLELDPCDREAADHLDPEGVGPGRYPNEIDPETALPACLEAVQRIPDVGRFHYQLGRVHLALRDFDAARASFGRARDLGHTRAFVALGLWPANADARTRGLGDDAPRPPEALALFQARRRPPAIPTPCTRLAAAPPLRTRRRRPAAAASTSCSRRSSSATPSR